MIFLFYVDAGSHHAAHDNLRLKHRGGTSHLSPVYLSLKIQTTHQDGGIVRRSIFCLSFSIVNFLCVNTAEILYSCIFRFAGYIF